jgi:hypothetical protein
MFFNKSKLEGEIAFLRVRVDLLTTACEQLETRIERLRGCSVGSEGGWNAKGKARTKSKEAKDVRIS